MALGHEGGIESTSIAEHLRECKTCQEYYSQIQQLHTLAESSGPATTQTLSPQFEKNLQARILGLETKEGSGKDKSPFSKYFTEFSPTRLVRLAAAFCLIGTLIWWRYSAQPRLNSNPKMSSHQIELSGPVLAENPVPITTFVSTSTRPTMDLAEYHRVATRSLEDLDALLSRQTRELQTSAAGTANRPNQVEQELN